MDSSESISTLSSQVRDLVNGPRRNARLRRDRTAWNQLCASLDVIDDAQLAIDAFRDGLPASLGGRYLHLYGVLQALFIQQDACRHLADTLKKDWSPPPTSALATIRRIRNDSVGHPTKSGQKAQLSFHFVSRPTLTHGSFQLLSIDKDGQQVRNIALRTLIEDQRREISQFLQETRSALMLEDAELHARYADQPVARHFPDALGYYLEKVEEGIRHAESRPLSIGCLGLIRDILSNVQAELEGRDEWDAADSIRLSFNEIVWPLNQLKSLLQSELLQDGDRQLAEVCVYALRGRLNELRTLVRDWDSSYSPEEPL